MTIEEKGERTNILGYATSGDTGATAREAAIHEKLALAIHKHLDESHPDFPCETRIKVKRKET